MRGNRGLVMGIIICAAVFAGCSAGEGQKDETLPKESRREDLTTGTEYVADTDTEAVSEENMPSYPSEEAGSILYESSLGYSCMYDPTVFVLDDTGEGDNFSYQTNETLAAPVYISIQGYSDMGADVLADGLVLQSGIDGLKAQDTYFGAKGIETKCVYLEQERNGVNQIQTFYVIPLENGSLLVEIGGYVGMPERAEQKLEEITGSFSLAG